MSCREVLAWSSCCTMGCPLVKSTHKAPHVGKRVKKGLPLPRTVPPGRVHTHHCTVLRKQSWGNDPTRGEGKKSPDSSSSPECYPLQTERIGEWNTNGVGGLLGVGATDWVIQSGKHRQTWGREPQGDTGWRAERSTQVAPGKKAAAEPAADSEQARQ